MDMYKLACCRHRGYLFTSLTRPLRTSLSLTASLLAPSPLLCPSSCAITVISPSAACYPLGRRHGTCEKHTRHLLCTALGRRQLNQPTHLPRLSPILLLQTAVSISTPSSTPNPTVTTSHLDHPRARRHQTSQPQIWTQMNQAPFTLTFTSPWLLRTLDRGSPYPPHLASSIRSSTRSAST
jgi:hypothetical protein